MGQAHVTTAVRKRVERFDSRPVRWLGAPSPGGLALPSAQPTAAQLYAPRGVWLDDERLVACDSGNHRVLIWNGMPEEDHEPAEIVLGQASFSEEGPAAHGRGPENGLHLPTGVIVAEGRLFVADAWHHRILVWDRVPSRSDTPPDWCLGQSSLGEVERNRGRGVGRDTLYWPYGLAVIAGRLHVADTGNRRVLIWNSVPDADAPADVVLGQPDGTSADENRGGPVGPASFRWPHAIAGDERMLFVADAGDHRVLGWRGEVRADRPISCSASPISRPQRNCPIARRAQAGCDFPTACRRGRMPMASRCSRWLIPPTTACSSGRCRLNRPASPQPTPCSASPISTPAVKTIGRP
jgi:hypothetical protein